VTTATSTTLTQTTPATTTVTTTPACTTTSPPPSNIAVPRTNPFNGRAMWIWEMRYTDGGNVAAIVAQARRYGIRTLYVKSSDGTSWWPQFSRGLVTALHEAGLRACAWQYVYGLRPAAEANLGYRAARDGADCLVIDAESQYETRYPAAQTYITRLRKLVGPRYPVGLAGFPYVDYHLSFPYSVFLGPGGAQYNLPQMYWADIGTTVPFVFAHTYEYNEIYRRPIFPLGQLWGRLSAASIEQFNLYARDYGATGVSWWDWQSAPLSYFRDITRLPPQLVGHSVNRTPASIFRGNKGDLVIWAQEHLYGAGFHIALDGQFGPRTRSAVRSFQRRHRLAATGVVNGLTWDALDRVTPVNVRWTRSGGRTVAVPARSSRLAGSATATTVIASVPAWMRRSHSRNELHRDVGAGGSPSTVSSAIRSPSSGASISTSPRTTTPEPKLTSPLTTRRSASRSEGGPPGMRASNSSIIPK
jgi:peptidoglycan hydrolase-like protein with peptidoglycan-binding domain